LQSQKGRGDLVPRLSRVTTYQRREAQFGFLGARFELNPDHIAPAVDPLVRAEVQ
jgi:hypothetical protein